MHRIYLLIMLRFSADHVKSSPKPNPRARDWRFLFCATPAGGKLPGSVRLEPSRGWGAEGDTLATTRQTLGTPFVPNRSARHGTSETRLSSGGAYLPL